jgi:diguanylate cyclase (GGDEF)-like protein
MSEIAKRLEKAEKLFQKGKHDLALEEYLAILKEEPANDKVRQQAADVCVSLNRNDQAATLLGPLFDRQVAIGDTSRAVITYKKLARLTTPTVERSFQYAQMVERNDRKGALDAYEATIAGTAAGRRTDCLPAMDRIVALDPSVANYERQGELATECGDYKAAALAFYRAGELELKAGGDGLSKFERAYQLDPSDLEAALAYSRALLQRGDAMRVVSILEPLVRNGAKHTDMRDILGRALLALKRPVDAEPYVWDMFQRDARSVTELMDLLGQLLDAGEYPRAIALSRRSEASEHKAGRRREYVTAIREVAERHKPSVDFLEYLVELYNNASREPDYCSTLMRLFDLYRGMGNFKKAADSLDRAAEVDPYEPGHAQRLEMLRGKIDASLFNSISHRLTVLGIGSEAAEKPKIDRNKQSNELEDLMLQAEIFLQYSMRGKALERLERIGKLFPDEDEKNPRLRQLYANAGFTPANAGAPRALAVAQAGTAGGVTTLRSTAPASSAVMEEHVDSIARVTDITRNIYRQGNVKSVLFTTVNEVGKHWEVSRCVAGLCPPGKPPSAALEYCAPGIKQSEVMSIVKLIGGLQAIVREKNVLAVSDVSSASELAALRQVLLQLGVKSLLAIPLMDGEEHVGMLILQQCNAPRLWAKSDIVMLKTIADQVAQAFLNARLRSLVKNLAVTDEKSGLLKRSSYVDVLLSEVKRAQQQNSTATVMLFNVGKAGALLKEAGEARTESMMQQVGQVMGSHLRQSDMAVRYDLTTIAIILSDTNERNAFFVVEKICRVLASMKSPATERPLTTRVGIAEVAIRPGFDPVDIVTEVINRAENALGGAIAEGKGAHALQPAPQDEAVA